MSSVNRHFRSFFPIWISFISCLIPLARVSSSLLNGSGEGGHPSLSLNPIGKVQLFTVESDVSCGLVIYGLHYVDVYIPFVPNFLRVFFIMKR